MGWKCFARGWGGFAQGGVRDAQAVAEVARAGGWVAPDKGEENDVKEGD